MEETSLDPEESRAWEEVLSRWGDDAAHRAYLARLRGLDALAAAGRRYRAVLDARPDDQVALRWRDEIVKRASAEALAQLPRTKPPRQLSPGLRRLVVGLMLLAFLAASAWAFSRLPSSGAIP